MFEHVSPFYEMRNPFLVLRLALFGVLVYVNVLAIGFAAWNLTVLKDLDVSVLGSPTFVVFNSCLLIALLALSFASLHFSIKFIDQVRTECAWTGVMSAMQLASSFAITANGPPVLCQGISILACASSSLVVALSWISCMILIMYSFSLFTAAITHMGIIPNIWTSSVCAIPWFVRPSTALPYTPRTAKEARYSAEVVDIKRMSFHYPTPIFEQHAKTLPPSPKPEHSLPRYSGAPRSSIRQSRKSNARSIPPPPPSDRRITWTSLLFVNSRPPSSLANRESVRPNWAKRSSPRRGVDAPFAAPGPRFSFSNLNLPPVRPLRPLKLKSVWSQTTVSSPPPVPALPQKAHVVGASRSPTGTFYIDLERDAVVPVGDASRPVSYGMFPEDVMDPDLPVTRARRSQWVRAPGSETSFTV